MVDLEFIMHSSTFQLEEESRIPLMGCYDYVSVYSDCSDEDPTFEECGVIATGTIAVKSDDNCVGIKFTTDDHVAEKGFEFKITVV